MSDPSTVPEVYDPNKEYQAESVVMISLDDTEIYTSNKEVPPAIDGSNGPANRETNGYWDDSAV